ncbi:hypothetical protein GCM10023189_48010 [Nibrella saemangeumensis]|uniref:Uncharacterized protein n=1 Tax=Nibrella saemangeumensis TaxID=1084526 RepID=A0ABP8NJ77_9BACT
MVVWAEAGTDATQHTKISAKTDGRRMELIVIGCRGFGKDRVIEQDVAWFWLLKIT